MCSGAQRTIKGTSFNCSDTFSNTLVKFGAHECKKNSYGSVKQNPPPIPGLGRVKPLAMVGYVRFRGSSLRLMRPDMLRAWEIYIFPHHAASPCLPRMGYPIKCTGRMFNRGISFPWRPGTRSSRRISSGGCSPVGIPLLASVGRPLCPTTHVPLIDIILAQFPVLLLWGNVKSM